jgi:hypothetical protein
MIDALVSAGIPDHSIKAPKYIASTFSAQIFVAMTIDDGIRRSAQLPSRRQ